MNTLINSKNNIVTYIIPLGLGNNLIRVQETIDFLKESMQILEATRREYEAQYSKRSKAYMFYSVEFVSIRLLHTSSFIYLAVKFFQNAQLDLKNILFGAGLVGFITTLVASSLLQSHLKKTIESIQKEAQEKSETLTLDDLFLGLEKKLKENKKYSILSTTLKYLLPLSIITMAAGLIVESALSDFKTVDTKLLIGVSLLILSFGLQYLANEIYERKVVNLVKEERAEGKLDDGSAKGALLAIEYNV